jgi:hypothetical protein
MYHMLSTIDLTGSMAISSPMGAVALKRLFKNEGTPSTTLHAATFQKISLKAQCHEILKTYAYLTFDRYQNKCYN